MIDNYVVSEGVWEGFRRIDLRLDGRDAIVIVPQEPAPEKPWVWRTEYFGAFPQVDIAMVREGWYIAYVDVGSLFAASTVLNALYRFYSFVVDRYGLSLRAAIFGFSRASHLAIRYAARFPHTTAALYLDNPLLDIRSQIHAPGNVFHSENEMLEYLMKNGMKAEDANTFDYNLLDMTENIMQENIPIIVVVGVADDVILESENCALLEKRYLKAGKEILILRKPGCGHHPHSLENPKPIIDFLLRNVTAVSRQSICNVMYDLDW